MCRFTVALLLLCLVLFNACEGTDSSLKMGDSSESKPEPTSPAPVFEFGLGSTPMPKHTPELEPTPMPETVPPPEPVTVPKPGPRDIMDEAKFEAIDHHALSTPESAVDSVESLAAYLTEPAKNDLERVRAIYRWVTENISYDVQGYRTGNYGDLSPEGVLTSGSAVCSGYAVLFAQLANEAGIEVVEISGWAKGISYEVGEPISGQTNHAWNAVQIDGGWYFIESTWGAGYVDGSRFIRRFEEHYFLTPPEQFVYEHLPDNPDWQLLETPISKAEIAGLPHLTPVFFKNGLEIGSHAQSVVQTDYQIAITLAAPAAVLLSARLKQNNEKLPRSLVFVQREGKQYQVDAVFPAAGDYILVIFAKSEADQEQYKCALDYKIEVSEGLSGPIGFPKTYSNFQEEGVYVYTPRSGYLQSGTTQKFKLKVPRAQKVAVIIGDQWHHLTKYGELFEGNVNISKGDITVSAEFPNQTHYDGLLNYTGL